MFGRVGNDTFNIADLAPAIHLGDVIRDFKQNDEMDTLDFGGVATIYTRVVGGNLAIYNNQKGLQTVVTTNDDGTENYAPGVYGTIRGFTGQLVSEMLENGTRAESAADFANV